MTLFAIKMLSPFESDVQLGTFELASLPALSDGQLGVNRWPEQFPLRFRGNFAERGLPLHKYDV